MSTPVATNPLPLKLLIGGRIAVAITCLFTPRVFARIFRMDTAGTPAIALGRMFAIRNAALAAGLLRLDVFTAPRVFLKLNVLIDLADAIALMAAGRRHEISTTTSILGASTALTAIAYGAAALAQRAEQNV
jgi:hypothetical protein